MNAELIHQLLGALEACKRAAEDKSRPASARLELVRDYSTPAIQNARQYLAFKSGFCHNTLCFGKAKP